MRKIISRGSVYRLGERGTRRKKRKPLTGKQLDELIQKNRDQEALENIKNASEETVNTPWGVKISTGITSATAAPVFFCLCQKSRGGI